KVGGTKDPIKVDMNVIMRVDVYQHVEKDLSDIDSIVYGSKPAQPAQKDDKHSLLGLLVPEAYAQQGLSKEVEDAALRRRDRLPALFALEGQGIAGENRLGLVEIRAADKADSRTQELVDAENADRMVIYRVIAAKNGISVGEVQKQYAKRTQQEAPSGSPLEILNQSSNTYEWKIK
ncbi:MAG: DUF1318 domain-containing protein, partial [Candidatus Omnitrophica bacterium]|nr:DUF1318 domain-containing protein [Candidatus Omnitrophota bacterium]